VNRENLDKKSIEILKIISEHDKPIGAKLIAKELQRRGYEIGERAVRYHLQILDERGLTKKYGYYGRLITDKGLKELENSNVSYRMGVIFSKIMEKLYLSDFPTKVVVNTAIIKDGDYEDIQNEVYKVIDAGYSVGDYIKIEKMTDNTIKIKTLCSLTFDNFLLKNGIMSLPICGGVVKYEDYEPVYFEGMINFKETTVDPLEAFISTNKTDVIGILENGNGYLPANFRVIPKLKLEEFKTLLNRDLLNGVISYGTDNVLGINLNDTEVGIVMVGGITPICPIKEMGYDVRINAATELTYISNLKKVKKNYIKPISKKSDKSVVPVISKIISWIHEVTYDIDNDGGKVVVNTGYIDKKYGDKAVEVLKKYCEKLNLSYKMISVRDENDKLRIDTISSVTFDGIFLKNYIPVIPFCGGILEYTENLKRFIDIIIYSGTSLDPYEVFFNKINCMNTILSGVRMIPMEGRNKLIKLIEKLDFSGILEVGKPNNSLYGIEVENGMCAYVSVDGLNPFALLIKNNIPVELISTHNTMEYLDILPVNKF